MLELSDKPQIVAYQAPAIEPDAGLTPSDLLQMLGRHKWFILTCTLVCLAASFSYLELKAPVYEASALVRIDPGRAGSLGLSDMNPGASGAGSDLIQTEVSVLQSDEVALRTLNSLSPDEFFRFAGVSQQSLQLPPDTGYLAPQQQRVVDLFKLDTKAKQLEGTQLLAVSFRNTDPRLAAEVVDRLVAAYNVQTFQNRDKAVSQLRMWLSAKMTALKAQVESSQQKLAAYQEENNFVPTDTTGNTITDRLRLLNDRLTAAQGDRIMKEAQMKAASGGDPATLAALFPNAQLDALQKEATTVNTKYAQLSSKFGAAYPPLVELREQLQTIDAQIAEDERSVRHRLQEEFDSAQSAEVLLQNQYDEQMHLAYRFDRNQAEYAALQAEVTSNRELYDTLRRKLQQAGVDAQVDGLNTMVVDSASIPTTPVEPKKPIVLGSGLVLGLFSGIACAFFFEAASDKLQNDRQIAKIFGQQPLATIPRDQGISTDKLENPKTFPLMLSSFANPSKEAYRALRNTFLLAPGGSPPKSVFVTSPLDGDGSSEVAANFGVSLAQAGFRVLMVDADLRRPKLHSEFDIENRSGLGELLRRSNATQNSSAPVAGMKNLYLLTAGDDFATSSDHMITDRMKLLLKQWEGEFDYIVLHSAALLAVSDGLLLASAADAVLLVTRYNVTKLHALQDLKALLSRINVQVTGVVLRDAPVKHSYALQGEAKYA